MKTIVGRLIVRSFRDLFRAKLLFTLISFCYAILPGKIILLMLFITLLT